MLLDEAQCLDMSEHRPVFALFDRAIRGDYLKYPLVASGTSLRMRQQVIDLMGSITLKEKRVGSPCAEPIILPLPYVDEDRVWKLLNHWIDLTKIKPPLVADVCHALTGNISFRSCCCLQTEHISVH